MVKFLVCLVLVTAVSCEYFGEPALHFDYNSEYASKYDNYKPRDYHFDYSVSDPHTGDHKSQWEVKENGVVRGGYSLLEPDGTTRIVEYIADEHGFRAVVKKLGTAIHPEPVQIHEKPLPVIEEVPPEVFHYRTYDGQINNYANILETPYQHIEPVPYVQEIEVPKKVEVHDYQNQGLVQPLLYQVQQSFQQHEIPYKTIQNYAIPVPVEVHDAQLLVQNNQPLISQPQADGCHGEISQEQYLGEIEVHKPRPVLTEVHDPVLPSAPAKVDLTPIGPSYHTYIEYHGLTGNAEDDSRYTNYDKPVHVEYSGEYSEKVRKVVPAPVRKGHDDQKRDKSASQQFLIYYPDPESDSHK